MELSTGLRGWTLAGSAALCVAAGPASACLVHVQTQLSDVKYADVVAVGRIANYGIVLDQKVREERKRDLARPGLPREYRKLLEGQTDYLSDYARFDILVDDVLVGKPAKKLTVTWDASTFGEPKTMPPGPYLIALRNPASKAPPLRGPSGTILPSPESASLTILHPPCAGAFIFATDSSEAATVWQILAKSRGSAKPLPPLRLPPLPPYIVANFAGTPSEKLAKGLYPARAAADEVEGSATIDCVAAGNGTLKCKVLSEAPVAYRFGTATVDLYQLGAHLKPGTYKAGDHIRVTRVWRLD